MSKISSIWFLPSENTWENYDLLAMKDRGTIIFEVNELVFKGSKYQLYIKDISSISYGKEGRDFVNNWIKIEYLSKNGIAKTAFFADGRILGWSGIFGGTKKILKKIEKMYLKQK